MRILTLFLALFLTLLPENASVADISLGQDVCCEMVNDVEEEAVIHTSQNRQEQPLTYPEVISERFRQGLSRSVKYSPVCFCFERQWLRACMLRL